MSAVDPALTAEVALRLALVFEACTAMDSPTIHVTEKVRPKGLTTQMSKNDSAVAQSRTKDTEDDHSLASASIRGQSML